MGIKGLAHFIKTKVPTARGAVNWQCSKTKTNSIWGIDCLSILFRARGANLSPITVLASLIIRMRQYGIEPIFVFDGSTPRAKSATVDKRRTIRNVIKTEMRAIQEKLTGSDVGVCAAERSSLERRHDILQKKAPQITSDDRDEVKRFLHGCGVRFITASGEADEVLAFLYRSDEIQAVVSTDMDMLARGVARLIVPESADTTVLSEFSLDILLKQLKLTYSGFVNMCVKMGCDYSAEEAPAILKGVNASWETIVSEKQREKWSSYSASSSSSEPDTIATFSDTYRWPCEWTKLLIGCRK